MPAFHFNPRRLRRTASVTLAVWLLALAAGVVNACTVAPTGPGRFGIHAQVALQHAVVGAQAGAVQGSHHHGQGELVIHRGHEQDAGQQSCPKVCDDESSAVVKVKLAAVDGGASLTIVAQPWKPIAATGSVGWRLPSRRPGSHGPPLVIRFLRLTL